ncbi:MAG: glycosyltransferase family 2 protein [Acidobacteria bacterium]|nr:glycosyltransferase family 2 protein [Acidobacteriota bacterium]
MDYFFYFLAALLIWMSCVSLMGGVRYLRYFRKCLGKPASGFTPFLSIIAPCKGPEEGLEQNLRALVEQDYPEYEVVFVVDDDNDAAAAMIREKLEENRHSKLIVAPTATVSSQKVENLREAVLHVSERSEAFVFVDSDVRPAAGWLRALVAPLEDPGVGAATGYRWFISKRSALASELRSVWNASVASQLGPEPSGNFCWGGSMAIRRGTFASIEMRDKWLGTLSDDLAMTRVLNENKLPVIFVPQALAASVENGTFRELLEFTTRQIKIVRVYATKLWALTFIGSGLFCITMIWAFLILLLSRQNTFLVLSAIVTLLSVSALSIGKAWLRLMAVRLVLTEYEEELRRQFFTQNTLWLVAPLIYFYNCAAALTSRRLTWRGITYELKSPTETVIIGR